MKQTKQYLFFTLFIFGLLFTTGCSHKQAKVLSIEATKHTSKARHKATLKPYVVKGKRYIPTLVQAGDKQYGVSSWYGPNFHGKLTSNGEVYNMYGRTAAHKTFPMDTIVRVDNLTNGKSTIVRINDRGPFVSGRIIDCSYLAGKELGLDKSGIAKVMVTVLGSAGKACSIKKLKKVTKPSIKSTFKPTHNILGMQLGAYTKVSGAMACARANNKHYTKYHCVIHKAYNAQRNILYRVMLVGFESSDELEHFKMRQSRIRERF